MSNSTIKPTSIQDSLQRNWGWLIGLGLLFVVLGTIGLGMVVGITLVSVLFLGAMLVVVGVSQLIDSIQSRLWKAVVGHVLIGLLYIVAGGLVIYDPLLASSVITAFIATALILIGVTRLIMAIALRGSSGWGWLFFAGLVAIILGGLILAQWPWSGLWVIGLFISIELIVNGWTYIFLAFAIKNSQD